MLSYTEFVNISYVCLRGEIGNLHVYIVSTLLNTESRKASRSLRILLAYLHTQRSRSSIPSLIARYLETSIKKNLDSNRSRQIDISRTLLRLITNPTSTALFQIRN